MTINQGGVVLKKSIGLWSGLLLISVYLVGCVSATELPAKQEEVVIDYMANMVLKHDSNMDYNIEYVYVPTLPPKVTVPPKATDTPTESDSPTGDNQSTKKPTVTVKPDDTTTDNPSVVLGISGISIEVKGYEIRKSYSLGDSFILEPNEGKNLMMVEFSLTNKGEQDKQVMLTAQMVDYGVEINGKDTLYPLMTALENDLLYLDKNIKTGESAEAVLVFQVDESVKIESVKLTMKNEKEKYAQTINKSGQ